MDHLPSELRSLNLKEIVSFNDGKIDDPQVIIEALEKTAWNKTKAAALLGISRRSIYRKIKEYSIAPNED